MEDAWEDAKLRYPVGGRAHGVVRVRRPFGVFIELDGAPEVIALLDIASYNPDPLVVELPEVGEGVFGEVAFHDEQQRQIRVRVGAPFWNDDAGRADMGGGSGAN
ncbi:MULTISPECIES: RNA-binding protein [unclassified Streptomyces]|uniref:RNA-binding protein n=1 Tax=unclassified Streptomyces TaxID=2593676 RepID=UPI000DB1F0C9|nr:MULTISPECIES: RNA-binding protein [unclassified Streptomyces]PZT74754.1 RNA-binding protein [Streptomyces sp. AC1-42T]